MKNLPAALVVVVLSVCPSYAQDTNEAEAHYKAGDAFYQENNYQPAIESLEKAIALFESGKNIPGIIKSQNLKGECLANLSQCDQAIAIISKSLELAKTNLSTDHPEFANTYYYLSRAHGGCARRTAEAIALMHQSMDLKRKLYGAESVEIAYDYNFMGYYFRNTEQLDSASYYLNKAFAIRTAKLPADDIEISHTLYFLARVHESRSEVDQALDLHLKAYRIRQKRFPEPNATVSNSLEAIGSVYQKMGNYERALDYFHRSLEIRKKTLGENHSNVANNYYNIGNLYNGILNYHTALQYYEQGNRIAEMNLGPDSDILATYMAVTGKLYGLTGNHKRGQEYISRARATAEKLPKDHTYRGIIYALAGDFYDNLNDYHAQAEYFTKAIAIFQKAYGRGSVREADVLFKTGAVSARNKHFDEAMGYYQEALRIYVSKFGKSNPKPSTVHHAIGNIYHEQGKWHEALVSYQKALAAISNAQGDSTDLYTNPDPEHLESKTRALKISTSKVRTLFALASKDQRLLGQTFATCTFAMKLIDLISADYNNEAAKMDLAAQSREVFGLSMEVIRQLYLKTNEARYLEEAFSVSERSKAAVLLENIRDTQAKTMAGVPDSLIAQENDLKIKLAYYKGLVFQTGNTHDKANKETWEKLVFDTQQKMDAFREGLERSYPEYYALKYNYDTPKLSDIQRLLPDEKTLAAEFFVGDSSIFVFTVGRKAVKFSRIAKSASFEKLLENYERSLTDVTFMMNSRAEADAMFVNSAHSLFDLLLGEVVRSQDVELEHLIIIPDGALSQVNFGTLLTRKSSSAEVNYALLPYLINQCNVSYAYSAAFLKKQSSGARRFSRGFAGFAPSYPQEAFANVDTLTHPLTYLVVRTGNLPLPGAEKEVEVISSFMAGSSWLRDEATETNFKKHAGDYGVLHLAMHSLLNNEHPEYSELLFNPARDVSNDGFLNVSEIYNLKLNAELVVLSACSSGYGKLQTGEGPISISRAFSYAGCPSVVMSLWKVPDAVTAQVMTHFYEELKAGKAKDEALRLAQVKFLQGTDDPLHHHPYFWAGFVVMGDTAPLRTGSTPMVIYGSIFVVTMALVAVAVKRRKQKRLVKTLQ